jgi:hypothetical protein
MNIDIKNLDFSLSKAQVIKALTSVLHEAPFKALPDDPRMNFHVHLYKAKNVVHKNMGSGLLTLPTLEVGKKFLQMHRSAKPFRIGNRPVRFSDSAKPLQEDVLNKIRCQPFADPVDEDERSQWNREHDASDLKVELLQFGWICRDYTFSVECEENCRDRCHMAFNDDRREIRLHLRLLEEFYIIVIPFASIINVSTSTNYDREHALVFYLNAPPAYEQQEQPGGKRRKLHHIPIPDHERVAPFTSMAIRIVCGSQRDIQRFRNLCRNARLNKVDEYDYPVEHRNLFSEADMISIIYSFRSLPWKVAFQMEALLRNMAIDFKEAMTLYPVVQQMVQEKDAELVAKALREFRNQTDFLFHSEEDDAAEIVELFMRNVDALDQEDIVTPPRPADGSLYEAFHVDITPTSMYLDGPFIEQSNRVIRAHDARQDCFLRVSFVDEARLQYRFDHEIDGREFIKTRIGPLLYNGFKVAGRRFEFLAYSQSALREHAVW